MLMTLFDHVPAFENSRLRVLELLVRVGWQLFINQRPGHIRAGSSARSEEGRPLRHRRSGSKFPVVRVLYPLGCGDFVELLNVDQW